MKSMATNEVFLPHLSDPFRRSIAVRYAQQELRKLLPQFQDEAIWESIDKQVEQWWDALSVRNFWNGIHGISMGFRLKSLVPWLTSLHIQWIEKDAPVEELWFGGKFGPIKELDISGASTAVKQIIFLPEHRELLKQTRKRLKGLLDESAPRDDYPIFVVRKEGQLRVIDGNRRLLKAIVNQKERIRAVVGEPTADPPFYEHWVPTSLLVELVFWHKQQVQAGRDTIDITARNIVELIRDSSAGRIEFFERAVHKDDEIHVKLSERVEQILAQKS